MKFLKYGILILILSILGFYFLTGYSIVTNYQEYRIKWEPEVTNNVWLSFQGNEYKKVIIPVLYDSVMIKSPYSCVISVHEDFEEIHDVLVRITVNDKVTKQYSIPDNVSNKRRDRESDGYIFLLDVNGIDIDNDKFKHLDVTIDFVGIKGGKQNNYSNTQRCYPETIKMKTNLFWDALMSV